MCVIIGTRNLKDLPRWKPQAYSSFALRSLYYFSLLLFFTLSYLCCPCRDDCLTHPFDNEGKSGHLHGKSRDEVKNLSVEPYSCFSLFGPSSSRYQYNLVADEISKIKHYYSRSVTY